MAGAGQGATTCREAGFPVHSWASTFGRLPGVVAQPGGASRHYAARGERGGGRTSGRLGRYGK
jgi:hypothetical protein